MVRTLSMVLASFVFAGAASATEVEVPIGAYLDLETGTWSTETDCFSGVVDCRGMDLKLRTSDTHQPSTFLEFARSVGQARTQANPSEVTASTLTDLAAYRYDSAFGFLPETLVVNKGTRTYAIQLVSEGNDKAVLRYEFIATQTASN